jgi:MFS family permease
LSTLNKSAEEDSTVNASSTWQFPYALRALRHRNFCLFFIGQFVSRTGYWMQNMAQSWLVYRLSQSSLMLGLVGFAGQFPTLLLGLLAGVVADRYNRYQVILVTLVLAMLQATVLGVLTLEQWITAWQVFFLAIFAGAVQTFEMPARQSFLMEIVGREDMTSAVALNSALVNGARIIGPALAGAVVAQVGEGACFLINAISYFAIIGGFLAMRLPARSATVAANISIAAFMREGVVYSIRTPVVRLLLVLIGLTSFLSTPYTVLMPIFAGDILHGGPSGMGMLMGAAGFGAVVGVMFLARHHTTEKIAGTIVFALIRFGLGLILFAFSRNFWLSMLVLPLVGSGFMLPMSAANTLLQILTPDHLRGRVMSMFFIVFMGTPPLGSLLAGFLAPHIGAPLTVASTGVLCLAGAAWFALKVHLVREAAEEEKHGEPAL